ncbi:MAG: VWA domain-containing protein, partial [Phycisphaerae bacterium]|nr:VWA domain-containing protein [Phycisphaerae bacterium]
LDASGSMKYRGKSADKRNGKTLSKFEYAQYLAACLSHLLIHQQDAVGLVTFDTQVRHYIPPRGRPGHLRVILEEIDQTVPGDETALAPIFHDIAERVHRRGLIIIISDMFDDIDEILHAMHHFKYRRQEVIVLHLMADEEINFPFDRFSDFRNLEVRGHNIQLDPKSIRSAYIEEVRRFTEELTLGCGRMHIDYAPILTSQPFDTALADYLAMRMGRYR